MAEGGTEELNIRLFGGFDARMGDKPLPPFRSQKTKWLLALLLLRHDQSLARTWLAETLWPDSLQSDALSSLRQCVYSLRGALGDQAWRLSAPGGHTLSLTIGAAHVDALAFDRAIQKGRAETWQEAITLYQGPLLPECSELWMLHEREVRQQAYVKAVEHLTAQMRAEGDYHSGIALLRQAMLHVPLDEGLCRNLIQTLQKSGDYGAAVETYQTFRNRLYDTAQIEPQRETQHLYQELRQQARKTASVSSAPPVQPTASRLPRPLTALIGRQQEAQAVESALLTARLITITGIGGAGKTRLALHVAEVLNGDYPDGIWFVDLSEATQDTQVAPQIASLLGVQEERGRNTHDALIAFLHNRSLLLVLDNCEHLAASCAQTCRVLLEACPRLRILATSRQKLGLIGEAVFPLPGLPLPSSADATPPETILQSDAVRLFLERAHAITPTFALDSQNAPAIASICRQLDGLPLALELAAPLVEACAVEEIAVQLQQRLDSLVTPDLTQPRRHQTLEAVMDWSYDRLTSQEQRLFRRLSVFAAGFTSAAAERVCAAGGLEAAEIPSLLARLVARSLLLTEARTGSMRYGMLETVHRYSRKKAQTEEDVAALSQRQRDYYLAFACDAVRHLAGSEQTRWLIQLETEHANIRAVLTQAPDTTQDAVLTLQLANHLARFWQIRGYFREGLALLQALVQRVGKEHGPAERADALNWISIFAAYLGDYQMGYRCAEQGLALWQEREDAAGMASSLGCLGIVSAAQGRLAAARDFFTHSLDLAERIGDEGQMAGALGYLGIGAASEGDYGRAQDCYERSLALREKRQDTWGIASSLNNLGALARLQGRTAQARILLQRSLVLRRALQDRRCVAITLNLLGLVARDEGQGTEAQDLLREGLLLCQEIGDRRSIAYALEAFAALAFSEGKAARSVKLLGAASRLRQQIAAHLPPSEQARQNEMLFGLEQEYGSEAFAGWWADGQTLPTEQTIRFALNAEDAWSSD